MNEWEVKALVDARLAEEKENRKKPLPYYLIMAREVLLFIVVMVALSAISPGARAGTLFLFTMLTTIGVCGFCIFNLVEEPWKKR